MIYRVIVRDARKEVARGEHDIWDVSDGPAVLAAARQVCNAENRTLPAAGKVRIEQLKGRRWSFVREVTL